MKALLLISAILSFNLASAQVIPQLPVMPAADGPITNSVKMTCQVPVETGASVYKLEILLGNDTSSDFITFSLTGPQGTEVLFNQIEKGALDQQIAAGQVGMLALQESVMMDNGVIKNAGLISLNREADGSFAGMLIALGSIYPLACK